MKKAKAYLGDSVYVEFDGHHLILTTENGYASDPSNKILLEPAVAVSLVAYIEALIKEGSK
jgi:hypothetical protein